MPDYASIPGLKKKPVRRVVQGSTDKPAPGERPYVSPTAGLGRNRPAPPPSVNPSRSGAGAAGYSRVFKGPGTINRNASKQMPRP